MSVHITTQWERAELSPATVQHLKLGFRHNIWTRLIEGIARFLVLRIGETPRVLEPGFLLLDDAIKQRGRV